MQNSDQGPFLPTYEGVYVQDTQDALLLVQAVINGKLRPVNRRPQDSEREEVIRSGNVFVFQEEQGMGIKRWTDGVAWSPSRILGDFLIYREKKPGSRSERQAYRRNSTDASMTGTDHSKYGGAVMKRPLVSHRTSPYGLPQQQGPQYFGFSHQQTPLSPFGSKPNSDYRLYGSLTNSDEYKEHGLIKKTMSVQYERVNYRLVSYYFPEDVEQERLIIPTHDPSLSDIQISPELAETKHIRTNITFNHSPYSDVYHPSLVSNPGYSQSGMGLVNQQGSPVNLGMQSRINTSVLGVMQARQSLDLETVAHPHNNATEPYGYRGSNYAYPSNLPRYADKSIPTGHTSIKTGMNPHSPSKHYPVSPGWSSRQHTSLDQELVDPSSDPNSANVFLDSHMYYGNEPEEDINNSLSGSNFLPRMIPQNQRHYSYQAFKTHSNAPTLVLDNSLKSPESPSDSKSGVQVPIPTEPNSAIGTSINTSVEFNSPENYDPLGKEFNHDNSSYEAINAHNRNESVHFLDHVGKNQVPIHKSQQKSPREVDTKTKDDSTDIFPELNSTDDLDDRIGYSNGIPARIITQHNDEYTQELSIDTAMFGMHNEAPSNLYLLKSDHDQTIDMNDVAPRGGVNPLSREYYASRTNPLSSNFDNTGF